MIVCQTLQQKNFPAMHISVKPSLVKWPLFYGAILFFLPFAVAQESPPVLTQEAYFQWIQRYHPLVRQANLLTATSAAQLLEARGHFDPKLLSELSQKSFDGKNYYTLSESSFKIPTWYGLELKALFNTASGINVNAENTIPAAGQAVLGIKASLGQGLFIDERRAVLQKARILQNANEAERLDAINNILLEAAVAYWDWVKAYGQLQAIEQALRVSQQRLRNIAESYEAGDRPAIDTLETFIQVQNWNFEQNSAQLKYQNAALRLSNFLWYDEAVPLELETNVRPPSPDTLRHQQILPRAEDLVQLSQSRHPQLRSYQFKLAQLAIDRKLALEALKPRLDLEYNLLGDGFRFGQYGDGGLENLLLQNYKWGFTFSFPVFLRKERGKLELNRLKMMDTDLAILQKQLEISNKVRDAYNEWQNAQQQIVLYEDIVTNYQRLLDAEILRFQAGESSIFLINSREQKLIEAQMKLVGLRTEFHKNRIKTLWATGQLAQ